MKLVNRITPLTFLLAIACMALLLIIWMEMPRTNGSGYKPEIQLESKSNSIGNFEKEYFKMRPIENYNEFTSRPLFNETRSPAESGPEQEQELTDQNSNRLSDNLRNYHLIGVMLTDSTRTAYIIDSRTYKIQKLANGDRIGDWSVSEIGSDIVVFNRGDGKKTELLLWQDPSPITQKRDEINTRINGTEFDAEQIRDENIDSNDTYILDEETGEIQNKSVNDDAEEADQSKATDHNSS